MWDYSGYSNYHALQTGVNRRYDNGLMFSFFYVWSKALGINNDDFTAGLPNATDAEIRRLDYCLLSTDRPHNFVDQRDLPAAVPEGSATAVIGADPRRLAAVGRLPLDERHARTGVGYSIPGIGNAEPDGQRRRQPGRAHRADLRSGRRLRRRPVPAVQHGVLRAAAARQRRRRVGALLHAPLADQQPRPLDLEDLRAVRRA